MRVGWGRRLCGFQSLQDDRDRIGSGSDRIKCSSCLEEPPGKIDGAPGAIPTRDLPLRRRTLYATELREHNTGIVNGELAIAQRGGTPNAVPRVVGSARDRCSRFALSADKDVRAPNYD